MYTHTKRLKATMPKMLQVSETELFNFDFPYFLFTLMCTHIRKMRTFMSQTLDRFLSQPFSLSLCVCMCVTDTHIIARVAVRGQPAKLVLSFHYVGSRSGTEVAAGWQASLPPEPSCWPWIGVS